MKGLPTEQCTARSKRSGKQCQHRVVGGGVCHMHGGKAPKVKAKQEARAALLAMEMKAKRSFRSDSTPAQMLLEAAQSAHAVVLSLRSDLEAGALSPALVEAYGQWLDRLVRTSSTVVSSKADELVIRQAEQVSRAQGQIMVEAVRAAIEQLELTTEQRRRVPDAVQAALASVNNVVGQPKELER